jgi:hypothetical protein
MVHRQTLVGTSCRERATPNTETGKGLVAARNDQTSRRTQPSDQRILGPPGAPPDPAEHSASVVTGRRFRRQVWRQCHTFAQFLYRQITLRPRPPFQFPRRGLIPAAAPVQGEASPPTRVPSVAHWPCSARSPRYHPRAVAPPAPPSASI